VDRDAVDAASDDAAGTRCPDPVSEFAAQNGAIRALLIHSPLVGPSTMTPLAATLRQRGWATTVADLRPAATSPAQFALAATAVADSVDVVIGHSGAGAFLPPTAASLGGATAVYIDAVVPSATAKFNPSSELLQLLDSLPIVDGMLPPWHTWWPAEVLAELVPDARLRRRITAEIPRVPRSFYDEPVPLPPRWWRQAGVYVQLSPAYGDDCTRAGGWGWPTSQIDGRHLDLCVRPEVVADHIIELIDEQVQRRA
jgi:hypothetical protein